MWVWYGGYRCGCGHGYGCGVACECMFIHALADDKWYGGYRLYYRDIVSTK